MKKIFYVIIGVIFSGVIYAEAISGSQSFYIGNGAKEIGVGYTGISEIGSLDGLILNPASMADTRRLVNSLSFGGIGTKTGIGIVGISYPFDFGVLSFNALYSGTGGDNVLNLLMGGNLAFSKAITENFFFGTGVKVLYGSSSQSDWAILFDVGGIVKNESDVTGFGFNDYSYGVVLRNIGKLISIGNYDAFPPMTLGVGGSFFPIKLGFYKLKLLGDINFPFYPLGFNVGIGLENILFDFIKIKGGYILSFPDKSGLSEVGPFSFGIGVVGKFKVNRETNTSVKVKFGKEKLEDSTEVSINYSLQPQKYNGVEELAHYVNLDIAWGYYDEKSPDLALSIDNEYFSPNFDGINDSAKIKPKIKDNTIVDGWKLEILDANDKVIKTFNSVEKLKLRSLDVPKFFKQLFSKKQSVDIPEYVEWNGMDESGNKVQDGIYYKRLTAWDENKNMSVSDKKMLIVDTVVPEVTPNYEYFIFSPNADNSKDELIVNLKSKGIQDDDDINFIILDSAGNEIKTFNFKSQVPEVVKWDGKDNNNKLAPEGEYKAFWIAKDKAGNQTLTPEVKITLVTNYQKISLTPSLLSFSPNNDGVKDNLIFYPSVSDSKGLEKWILKVNETGKTVRTFEGQKSLPKEIFWDGKGDNRLTLKDGNYEATLQLFFDSGNYPVSEKLSIIIDTTPPEIFVEPEYLSFSPNGDGKQDTLTFNHKVKGKDDEIMEAKIVNEFGNIVYYNKSTLKEFPNRFTWTGLDKDFKPLPEGKYTYIVEGIDSVGNRAKFEVKNIFLKTGLEQVTIQADVLAISPKNKDANREVTFATTVGTKKGIVDFTLEILKGQQVVYTFKTNTYVEKIVWDGKDNKGNILSDGDYSYRLKVKYDFGDEPVSAIKPISIDSIPPEVEILTKDYAFSPNGDGRKENFVIKQKVKGGNTDTYKASIIDGKNNIVRSYTFTGNVPEEILWDGKDDKGVDMPEGVYKYRIDGVDLAGNKTVREIPTIKLVRAFERLNVTLTQTKFSPALGQKLIFNIETSSINDLENATFSVLDGRDNVLTTIKLATNQNKQNFEWNGNIGENRRIPDGVYKGLISFEYASGNRITTNVSIVVDSTPPRVVLNISPEVFTPDGDGEDDVMFINLDLDDLTDVKNWNIKVSKIGEKKSDLRLFKTFSGKGKGKTLIQWDGTGDDKEDLIEAVQDYLFELSVEDEVGNKTNITREFTTGVLVERTPEGLRIRVSSILFAFDRATFVGDYQKPLNRIILILRRIMSNPEKYGLSRNFKIEISGHTDDVGGEDYNQKLSERRAKAVYDYLVKNDIDPNMLTFVGYGKSRPYKIIKPGMSKEKVDEYRSRNRRVEFFIKK